MVPLLQHNPIAFVRPAPRPMNPQQEHVPDSLHGCALPITGETPADRSNLLNKRPHDPNRINFVPAGHGAKRRK
jgi:hypothetical protein